MKLPSIYQIRDATLATAPKFFSKENLRFAGQTMRSFEVRRGASGRIYILAPLSLDGKAIGTTIREFTGDSLKSVSVPSTVRDHLPSVLAWVSDEG